MTNNTQDNKCIAKNTLFLYIRMMLMFIMGFYITRVILKNLGVEDFGTYNAVAAFVAMLGFLNTAMSNGIQRFINFEFGKNNIQKAVKYISNSITVQLCICGALLLIFETIGIWFVENKMIFAEDDILPARIVFHLSVATLVLNMVSATFNAIIIAKERMDFYAYISIFEVVAQLGIAHAISISESNRLIIYVSLLLVLNLILTISKIIYSKKILPELSIKPSFDKDIFKELLSFSGWNLFGSASGTIKSQGINILMNIFFGVTINAARGIAFQVLSGVQKFTSNFQLAINPQIVQSFSSNNRERYLSLTYTSAKISFYLMWIITLPVLFSINTILHVWLGDNIPECTSIFVILILLTGLIDSLGSSISISFYATGNIKKYQIIVSSITIMVLPISYILYRHGMEPATSMYVSLFLSVIAQIARVIIWCNTINESPSIYFKKIVVPIVIIMILSTSFMFLLNYIVSANDIIMLCINTILSIFINVICIYMIALDKNERNFISKHIKFKL